MQPKVRILGTGTSQGVPVVGCECAVCTSNDPKDNRLRVSAIIENGKDTLLIDAGPDLRAQLLRAKISDVDAVLITHEHNDHVAGLDDLRPINFLHRKTIPIYALRRVVKVLENSFRYIFDEHYDYPGKPKLELRAIEDHLVDGKIKINDTEIIPIHVMHGSLPIVGFRIGGKCYLTDVKTIDPFEFKKLKDLDTLILNALHHREHHSHLNTQEALMLAQKIGAQKTYFTHMSHRMGLHVEVEKTLPPDIYLAYDGLVV